jgi:hypothetical protein
MGKLRDQMLADLQLKGATPRILISVILLRSCRMALIRNMLPLGSFSPAHATCGYLPCLFQ